MYTEGAPHKPMVTITGHFTAMVPADGTDKLTESWYRADEVFELKARIIDLESQLANLVADQVRLAELELEVHELKARRPPKRAGEKT